MRTLVLIINRLLWFVPTLVGLMIITFTISHIIPADPVAFFAGENATNEQIEELRARYGFDKPLHIQLINYLIGITQGDLGISIYTQRPISEDLLFSVTCNNGTYIYGSIIVDSSGDTFRRIVAIQKHIF